MSDLNSSGQRRTSKKIEDDISVKKSNDEYDVIDSEHMETFLRSGSISDAKKILYDIFTGKIKRGMNPEEADEDVYLSS